MAYGVEFINRTILFEIKHDGPIQFRVKSIIVLCALRWRMIFNLSHDVFCASKIHNVWNYDIYYKNDKVNTCMITSSLNHHHHSRAKPLSYQDWMSNIAIVWLWGSTMVCHVMYMLICKPKPIGLKGSQLDAFSHRP